MIAQLETDPALAKTHHRKAEPWRPGWAREIHVWPYLVRIEFLVTVIVTVILFVWSILLNAPLEEPANPNLTMNPSKAPWYFLGLQEMLVYFDPWIAGVVMPSIIIIGLMVFPYVDSTAPGNGYYTLKQRRFAVGMLPGVPDVDSANRYRNLYPWTRLDLVLARADLGSQCGRVRQERRLHDWIATSRIGKALHLKFPIKQSAKFIFKVAGRNGFYVLSALFFHWLMTVDFEIVLRPFNWFPKDAFEQSFWLERVLQYATFSSSPSVCCWQCR